MEWLHPDSLLRKEDLNVLKFSQMSSMVLSCDGKSSPTVQTFQTDEELKDWLGLEEQRGGEAQARSGMTFMLGGRKNSRIRGNEASYLPFSEPRLFCDRVVPVMQIHRSISRVINRNTTATFSAISTKHTSHGGPLLVYNCRSSAEWPNDMALTVTYSPVDRSTHAVAFGCSDTTRGTFVNCLSVCDIMVYHPLTIPTMFAEIERDRQFRLVDQLISDVERRAVNITKPQSSDNRPIPPDHGNPRGGEQSHAAETTSGTTGNPQEFMELWLKVSALKRGLEAWRQQLEDMISHCTDLMQDDLHIPDHSSDDSTWSTVVEAVVSTDTPAGINIQSIDLRDLKESGRRIGQKLTELKGEYDEKIRGCNSIVKAMMLAAQLEWNTIVKLDTQTNLELAQYNLEIATSTGDDSKQMRSIALLTMVFLPATFVATLFSTPFFEFGPVSGDTKAQVQASSMLWMYFVVTLGLTGIVMLVWYCWTKRRPRRPHSRALAKGDVEMQPLANQTAVERNGSTVA